MSSVLLCFCKVFTVFLPNEQGQNITVVCTMTGVYTYVNKKKSN